MFREMRRKAQGLTEEQCLKILKEGSTGVLGVLGDDGYPYTVPLNFVWSDDGIYFHCALKGHKTDAVAGYDKTSLCVIDREDVFPEEFTTCFRSVIVFGRASVVENQEEKRKALELLVRKYCPEYLTEGEKEINAMISHTGVIKLIPEQITGKEASALKRERAQNT